jgi:hypothetical protein
VASLVLPPKNIELYNFLIKKEFHFFGKWNGRGEAMLRHLNGLIRGSNFMVLIFFDKIFHLFQYLAVGHSQSQ